jgi:hypothetical protein
MARLTPRRAELVMKLADALDTVAFFIGDLSYRLDRLSTQVAAKAYRMAQWNAD